MKKKSKTSKTKTTGGQKYDDPFAPVRKPLPEYRERVGAIAL